MGDLTQILTWPVYLKPCQHYGIIVGVIHPDADTTLLCAWCGPIELKFPKNPPE